MVPDPLGEKYYGINPYAYCNGDPVNFVDIDGQEISKWKEFLFALKHPKAAKNIGRVVKGKKQTNISTNTVRFATRGQVLKGSRSGETEQGSDVNAFRHALWQAAISSKYGETIAKQAGNAHESGKPADLSTLVYSTLDEADKTVDVLNNEVGRGIGLEHKNVGMKELALLVLDMFSNDGKGLYTVHQNKDGQYVISRTKLDAETRSSLEKIFKSLNDNAFYEHEIEN